MFGIIDENKKFILIDENREKLRVTALMLSSDNKQIFNENTVDEAIKEYNNNDIETVYTGEKYIKGFAPKPDNSYQSDMRQMAYTAEIDPLTSHIQRLRDEEQTIEIIDKITKLITERKEKVEKIKEKYPYFAD